MSDVVPADVAFLHYLKVECGYANVRPLPGGRWAATMRFMFTHAIIVGAIGDRNSYSDRWCYLNEADAAAALQAWDGFNGEPEGWHRHPGTGRRRKNGEEYIVL